MSSDNREKDLELIKEKLKELDIPVGEVVVEKILPEAEKKKIASGQTTTKQRPRFLDKIKSAQNSIFPKVEDTGDNSTDAPNATPVNNTTTNQNYISEDFYGPLPLEEVEEEKSGEQSEMFTTCEALKALKEHLHSAPTPLLKKDYVLVHRAETLALIDTLVKLCDESPFDYAILGDGLLNKLSGCTNEEETGNEPLSMVKSRVQKIIGDAMIQADLIINDAKILSHQLLSNTEKKIQARYDEAEEEISARVESSKEESTKRITEATKNLTSARKQSEDILKKYLEKAEDDYEGYWERAEKHLEASYKKSYIILDKAATIYEKELKAIKEDLITINSILRELSLSRPGNKRK